MGSACLSPVNHWGLENYTCPQDTDSYNTGIFALARLKLSAQPTDSLTLVRKFLRPCVAGGVIYGHPFTPLLRQKMSAGGTIFYDLPKKFRADTLDFDPILKHDHDSPSPIALCWF